MGDAAENPEDPRHEGHAATSPFSRPGVVALCAVVCCLLWGSAVPCVRLGFSLFGIAPADTGDQLVFAGVRFMLAGAGVVIVRAAATRGSILPSRDLVRGAVILSAFQTSGQYLLYYVGLAHSTGVNGSIVQGISVFVALLASALVFRLESLTDRKVAGCVIGFVGLAVADAASASTGGGFTFLGEGLIMLSSACTAFGAPVNRRLTTMRGLDPVALSGWQFVIGGATLALIGALLGGGMGLSTPEQAGILAWLSIVSAVAYSLWGVLLAHNDVSHVSVWAFLTPVFGVILSLAILGSEGHPVGLSTLASLVLVCLGIWVVSSAPEKDFPKESGIREK